MPSFSANSKDFFQKVIYTSYAKLLGITLDYVQPDALALSMPLTLEEHNNASGFVHGGVIMSLADTAMGSACFSYGYRVTTMEMNINFIKGAKPQGRLKAVATIIHSGSRTMVAEAEIFDSSDVFIAKARGTFFITGSAQTEATF